MHPRFLTGVQIAIRKLLGPGRSLRRSLEVLGMGWVLAILVVGVGDTVLHPYLHGLLIASILIVPLWIATSVVGAVIDAIFGRRK